MALSAVAAVLLLASPPVHAEDLPVEPVAEAAHPMSGTWRIATSEDKLRTTLDAAIEDVAAEFNILIRELVRHKLSGATKVCDTYVLDVKADTVDFSCNGNPPVALKRDGSPFQTQNDAGEPVRGTVAVQGERVVVTWMGEAGGRINTFSMKGGTLRLDAKVTSSHMPKPLKWTVDYAR